MGCLGFPPTPKLKEPSLFVLLYRVSLFCHSYGKILHNEKYTICQSSVETTAKPGKNVDVEKENGKIVILPRCISYVLQRSYIHLNYFYIIKPRSKSISLWDSGRLMWVHSNSCRTGFSYPGRKPWVITASSMISFLFGLMPGGNSHPNDQALGKIVIYWIIIIGWGGRFIFLSTDFMETS